MASADPAVTVVRATGDADWHDAAAILVDYQRWLAAALGVEITLAQPTAAGEFEDLRRFYRAPHGTFLVARAGGRPVGVLGVHRIAGGAGELKRMYVSPAARGLGLGRRLVAEAVAAARDLGFTELLLQTKPGVMPTAHRLYRELGFVPAEPYAALHVEDAVAMSLDLRPGRGSGKPRSGTLRT